MLLTSYKKTNLAIVLVLGLVFVTLNALDIMLTWRGMSTGGIELNSFMNEVLKLGVFESVVFKLGVSAVLAAIMMKRKHVPSLLGAVVMMGIVCIWNFHVITNIL